MKTHLVASSIALLASCACFASANASAPVLAESPRTGIVTSPSQTGPANIKVDANGTEAKGQLRNIGVSLSAPKTTLQRGERATATVQVQGLQNLSKPAR
jgi:hypothetical protein